MFKLKCSLFTNDPLSSDIKKGGGGSLLLSASSFHYICSGTDPLHSTFDKCNIRVVHNILKLNLQRDPSNCQELCSLC